MRPVPALRKHTLAICAAVAALAVLVPATGAGAPVSACARFASQAEAQDLFIALKGRPSYDVGGFDADADGVACEGSPAPYAGYATIGYNRAKGFFYGIASMPVTAAGGEFACLEGNRHFPDGPRRLHVYKVRPGEDLLVSRALSTEARPESGQLLWKLEKDVVPGRYYAVFEERQREGPFKPPECPSFRTRETLLPRSAAPRR